MVAYKSKVAYVEYYTPIFYLITNNRNKYPREELFCDYSSEFCPYDGHLCDTSIPENTYISSNEIIEIRYFFLSSLHISGTKYRIHSGKKQTATNITIHKITESIEYNKILDFTDDKGVIHLLKGSIPIFHPQYYSLICIKNYLFIVGIGPIHNKDLICIFRNVSFVCKFD